MWEHNCPEEGEMLVGDGEECNWCGRDELSCPWCGENGDCTPDCDTWDH